VPSVAHLRAVPVHAEPLDPATVAAAKAGLPWAQQAVLERFERPVWAVVCRILGRAGRDGVADDVAQDALLAVLRGLPRLQLDHGAPLATWVLTIAARTALSELRRRHPPTTSIEDSELVADERPDHRAEQDSSLGAIADAVETLTPEIRATFVLRAYHELAYPEIAEILGVDLGTVKSRLFRARAALQRRLSEVKP
jgi:RNA polymerase sigma-70 factor, ECF subfamily